FQHCCCWHPALYRGPRRRHLRRLRAAPPANPPAESPGGPAQHHDSAAVPGRGPPTRGLIHRVRSIRKKSTALAMTPTEIAIIISSFRKVVPIADQAAALFYARLFELDPALRALFRGNMHEQGKNLMAMLAKTVALLDKGEMLLPVVRELGARHAGYGAMEEHYATVGAALIWTLQKGLGPEFTPAVSAAWTKAYSLIATTMIEAQRTACVAA